LNWETNFGGLKVLDIGCGHGSLCVYIAQKSPKKVIGIDINANRINFAKANIQKNFPHLSDIVEFQNVNIESLDEYGFDIVLSKNTFEHIQNLDKIMPDIVKRMKEGGYFLVGFGPLYNSFYGDHKMTHSVIPWGHLLRSEKNIMKALNKKGKKKINSIFDLGLNKYSLKQYENLFNTCGLNIIYYATNRNSRFISKIFTQLARIGFLREYFTHNIYCVLRK